MNETVGVLRSRVLVVGVGGSQNGCQLHAVVGLPSRQSEKAMVEVCRVGESSYRRADEGVVGTESR